MNRAPAGRQQEQPAVNIYTHTPGLWRSYSIAATPPQTFPEASTKAGPLQQQSCWRTGAEAVIQSVRRVNSPLRKESNAHVSCWRSPLRRLGGREVIPSPQLPSTQKSIISFLCQGGGRREEGRGPGSISSSSNPRRAIKAGQKRLWMRTARHR